MHKTWKAAVVVLAVSPLAWSPGVSAQDKAVTVIPVELHACTFKEGKGMADMAKVNERFAKWAKKHAESYSAWTMVPHYRANDGEFDVGWIGAWTAGGESMGKILDRWAKDSDGLAADYDEVVECSRTLVSSAELNAPDGPADNGLVMFSSCTLDDDSNSREAFAAHKKFADSMRGKGGTAQSWLMYPALGMGKMEFDYYHVTGFKNYEELGTGWEMYTNGDGYKEWASAMGDVTSCDSPRLYNASLVVGNKR